MIKKIITLAIILGISISIIGLSLSDYTFEETNTDIEEIIKSDIIIPIKVSRPGCDVENICYIPSTFVVEKGNSVTWINEDSSFHTVTSGFYGEPDGLFDSTADTGDYLDPYQSYTLSLMVNAESGILGI